MDDQYLEAFIQEAQEEIPKLNNSLLDLESDPANREAMDQIFRTAHTLKGNFGAMAFEDAANLAHALEDLLDAMRQGDLEVTPEVMDLVFAGVDLIEAIVRDIEATGDSSIATDETVAELRTILEDGAAAAGGRLDDEVSSAESSPSGRDGTAREGSGGGVSDPDLGAVTADHAAVEDRIVHVGVDVGDTDMPGVDAMFALMELEEGFDILDADPDRERLEAGEYERTFSLLLDARGTASVEDAFAAVSSVAAASVTDVTDRFAESGEESTTEAADAARDAGEVDGAGGGPEGAAEDPGGPGSDGDDGSASQAAREDPAAGTSAGGTPASGDGRPGVEASASGDGGTTTGGTATGGGDATGTDGGVTDAVDEIKSVRVDVDELDDLHGQVEQLVTSRIKLRRAVEEDDLDAAGETLNELDKITANLQNTVMDMRLIPLKKVVGKFPRLVRDLARDLDKEVQFTLEGEDIELDRTILTEISDPLMHILRNAVDHGIELPEERVAAGKPRSGQVELKASRERDQVVIEVVDDGAGLDVDAIERQAIQQDVRSPEELETMADSAVFDLIFHPGFSTAEEVTDTSGRGVGMDVVHETVTQLDGSVSVDSEPGEGTTVSLRLPVTMAIVKVLFVEVGGEEYGIPIKNVDEITRTEAVKQVNGQEVIKHNEAIYPVIPLGDVFEVPGDYAENGDGMLVRIRESERQVALRCDAVNAQEEVVVKPLEGLLSGTPGLSGTAVLGDGNIVHILDVVTL